VIGKISDPRGQHVEPLIYYLYGPGRREEHTDPHIIAGWRHPAELEPPLREDGRRDFRRLNGLLNQPHAVLGERGLTRPVWHCAVRAAPEDRLLSDDEWAQVACDLMHRTGLSPYGQEDDAVRWVAIRHGEDHIHLVALLARQDGGKPRLSYERYRVREACRAAEERYGLRRTAPGDRTAARCPSRAETEKTQRHGWQEAPRATLRRHVSTAAAGAASEREFFVRLRQAGVQVRTRFSTRAPGEVTGYAVALPGDTTRAGGPVWYSGGKLAADLTLPRLRCRWEPARSTPGEPFTPEERNAIWEHAARTAAEAAGQIRALAATSPADAADAAWAAADTLHAAASALGSRVIRRAADAYDRAARAPYGRIPRATPSGNSLRRTARLLSATALVTGDSTLAQVALITRLAALAETIAGLRDAQQHAAQAAAARRAAECLHAAARTHIATPPREHAQRRAQTPAELAGAAFPMPPGPLPPRFPAPGAPRPAQPAPRPSRGPESSRPRGPEPVGQRAVQQPAALSARASVICLPLVLRAGGSAG